MTRIPLLIVVLYVILLYAVTWYSRRLSKGGMIAYLLAGRGLPPIVAAALLAGLAVGGASTVGVAERAFTSGLAAGWYNAAWAFGAILMGLTAAGRYRRLEICTLPELFERHFSTAGRVLGVAGQIVIQLVITALQYVAGGAILSALLPDVFTLQTGMLVTAVVFVGITLIGGFWAAGLTNIINVALIYVGVVLGAVLSVGKAGGLATLTANLPRDHGGFDLGALGWGVVVAWFAVMSTTAFSTQSVVQIGFATRDARASRRAYLIGGLMILPVGFISALIGMAGAAILPDVSATEVLPQTIMGLNPFVAGIVLAGLWAADVSTACALLMGSSMLVVGDLLKRFLWPNLGAQSEQRLCRLTVLCLSAVTFLLALTVKGILKMLLVGLTLNTAYALLTLMVLYLPGWCRRSHATVTLIATGGALVLWELVPQIATWTGLPHPIFFTWIASIVAFLVVLVIDRRPIPPPTLTT